MKITTDKGTATVRSIAFKETPMGGREATFETEQGTFTVEMSRKDILQLTEGLLYSRPTPVANLELPNA